MDIRDRIKKILSKQSEKLIFILRVHLLIEYFLGLIIENYTDISLSQSEKFNTKMLIVRALNFLPTEIMNSIKEINIVRNKFGHVLDYEITENDLDKIVGPIKKFQKDGKIIEDSDLEVALMFLLGFLDGRTEVIRKIN